MSVQATRTPESHLHNTMLKGHSFSIDFTVTFLKTYLKIIIHSQDLEKCNREVSLQTSPLFIFNRIFKNNHKLWG